MKSPKKLMLCRKHGDERDRLKKPEGSVLFDLLSNLQFNSFIFSNSSTTSTHAAASACTSYNTWHCCQASYQSSFNFINTITTHFAAN